MYSGTRFSIERQLAPMQIGIRNVGEHNQDERDAIDPERPVDRRRRAGASRQTATAGRSDRMPSTDRC